MDGIAYVHLLNQLDSEQCDLSGLKASKKDRFKQILKCAKAIGAIPFITHGDDISDGHFKLNLMFVASIFNRLQGMT